MIRAYLFALDPTEAQAGAMASHCGAARVAYHWALAQVMANWAQRATEQTYGLTGDEPTPWINTPAYNLRKAWNAAKHAVAPWWSENSKEAYATGCANLALALGNRTASRARMPHFKSRRRSRPSCRFTTGSVGPVQDRRHMQLPAIGVIRTHESTRTLARKIEAGHARIRSATLSFQRGHWHVSFSVELPDVEPPPRTDGRGVGVDLGISSLAVLSTGEHVPNPRRLGEAQRALRRTQRACARRRGPDRRTSIKPSQRWRKARARAERIHTRIATLRRNDTHQLTTRLVRQSDTIAIEDLHVAGMLRNHHLARHIADTSWAQIRRQLTDKTDRAGVRLVMAGRWFASSKTCSGCGTAKTKLTLSERTFVCTACGLILDRDLNTARNLAALAADTAQLVREQPEGTGVRRARPAGNAVRPPREESRRTQHQRREALAR